MKHCRKTVAILFLLLLCIPLGGCGAFQAQMAKTTTKMSKLDNFHADAEIYLGGTANIGGQKVRVKATILGGFDAETDPLLLKTDLHLSVIGREWDLHYYIQKEYDTWDIYPWDADRSIERMSTQLHSARRSRTVQALKLLIKCSDFFMDPVDDTVNGAHARRYDGIFPEEYVDEALVLLNLKKEDELETPEVSMLPSPTPSEKEPGEEHAEPEEIRGMPGSIWINDDDMIVQVDADLCYLFQKLLDEGTDILHTDYDLDGLKLDTELAYMDCRLTFSQFDEVAALRLPEG